MTPPSITHTHIWDGSRHLPDWLTGHRWTAGQLVIRTPDGDTRPQAGWWLIGWTDGSVTAATPTVAERVYGDDGIAGQLERAEAAIDRVREAAAHYLHEYEGGEDPCAAAVLATLDQPGPAATEATEPTGWLHAGTRDLNIPEQPGPG